MDASRGLISSLVHYMKKNSLPAAAFICKGDGFQSCCFPHFDMAHGKPGTLLVPTDTNSSLLTAPVSSTRGAIQCLEHQIVQVWFPWLLPSDMLEIGPHQAFPTSLRVMVKDQFPWRKKLLWKMDPMPLHRSEFLSIPTSTPQLYRNYPSWR